MARVLTTSAASIRQQTATHPTVQINLILIEFILSTLHFRLPPKNSFLALDFVFEVLNFHGDLLQ
jgi:hypothetical protein